MKKRIFRTVTALSVLAVLLTGLGFAGLPGVSGTASADKISLSSSDQKKINDKCKSVLGSKASKLDQQACVSGYLLALEKASNGDCNKPPYKGHSSAVNACKNTGYNLGKKNAAHVTVKKPPAKKPACTGSSCAATPTGSGNNCDGTNKCDLIALYINPIIKILSIVVGLIVAASLVMGGVQYAASSGDPQKIGAAKSRISNALLAFFAFAFMYAFLNFLIPGGIF